jgi:hypothetical protein
MLIEYAYETGRFENVLSDLSEIFEPVVAPGMAVKLYADRNHKTTGPFLDTTDLDITVFMKRKVGSKTELRKYVSMAYERFDDACEEYARFIGAKLIKRCPGTKSQDCPVNMTRKQGSPFFDRHVYAFKKYYIQYPKHDELHELMDVVIVYQSGVPSDIVNRRIRFGFPVPKVKYLIRELESMVRVDILGPSPFNQKRHPVTGKESLKGVKDLYRLQYILTLSRNREFDPIRRKVRHLLNILRKDTYSDEQKSRRLREVLNDK